MYSFRRFDEVSATDWDALVEGSPDGWVWALTSWRRLILSVPAWGLEDLSFAVATGSKLLAVMPLQYYPAARKVASSGWGLVGPVLSAALAAGERAPLVAAILRHAEALAQAKGASQVEVASLPLTATARTAAWGVNPFVPFGYEDHSTHARILDLAQGADAIWAGASKTARQQVKRAQSLGHVVRRLDWAAALDRYYELHATTYRRTGVVPHPREYFEGIARELAPRGHAVLWAAVGSDGIPIAFRNDARLGDGVLYHTGCSTTEALDTGVNYLLAWEAIRGAIADGFRWYEMGEVFPAASDGKTRGLTEFKSRFGGDLRRSFKASRQLSEPQHAAAAVEPVEAPGPTTPHGAADADDVIRKAYGEGTLYATQRICLRPESGGDDYADRLLQDKLALVGEWYRGGRVVDLCCGAGAHLVETARAADRAIGVDFSQRYLVEGAREAVAKGLSHVSFVQGDARRIPLAGASVDLLYCFSSLYAVPNAEQAVAEIGRVLRPQGVAILDFGNRRSLNVFCLKYYPEWPPIHALTIGQMRRALASAGLIVLRHRRFQVLPLWAGKPAWLWPLLHPVWKRIFRQRLAGRMLDEWVARVPGLRSIAFRHLIVCQKPA